MQSPERRRAVRAVHFLSVPPGYDRRRYQMSMTDPIADMLTRIRNACGSKHRRVDMPSSKMKIEIARLLKESNFIQDFQTLTSEEGRPVLRIRLKYAAGGQ